MRATAIEQPGKLRVCRHLALIEEDAALGIDARGDIGGRDLAGARAQLGGLLPLGDGMQVDDAEDARVIVLQPHPVPDRAQVVAEMQIAGGLDAREDAVHGGAPSLVK